MRKTRNIWMIIIAICAMPVILPVAVALGSVAFALIVSLLAIVFALAVSGAALVLGGIVSIVAAPFAMTQDFGLGILLGGQAFVALGLGILLAMGTYKLARWLPQVARRARRPARQHENHNMPYMMHESADTAVADGGMTNG